MVPSDDVAVMGVSGIGMLGENRSRYSLSRSW